MNSIRFRRIGAFLIDAMIINGFFTLVMQIIMYAGLLVFDINTDAQLLMLMFAFMFFQSICALVYTLICYKVFKGTLGKRVLKLKVIKKATKQELTTSELISREWSKWIIVYLFVPFGLIINIILYFSKDNSIHDVFSKTTVVDL